MVVGPLLVKQVLPPADLATIYMKQDSGKLDPTILVNVGPSGNLHHDAARAYKALAFMCMAIGLPLTYTYGGTYRNYQSQVSLFLQRYTKTVLPGRPTKVWQGVTYYQLPNTAMAAVPGTSNHGWGLAIDFAFDSDVTDGIGPDDAAVITSHPQWPIFKQYAIDCGFSWETTSEPWHLRLVTGSTPTQTVLNAETVMYPPPPVPVQIPSTTPPPSPSPEDDMKLSVLTLNNTVPPTTFLGYSEPHPNGTDQKFWRVTWIDGNNPNQVKMLTDQMKAGAVEYKYGEHVAASLIYENRTLPSSVHSDGRAWKKSDWGDAPNVP
jgi:D-alanyl-D-alanine carboxypeptidase